MAPPARLDAKAMTDIVERLRAPSAYGDDQALARLPDVIAAARGALLADGDAAEIHAPLSARSSGLRSNWSQSP
jgi:hypothetical protein